MVEKKLSRFSLIALVAIALVAILTKRYILAAIVLITASAVIDWTVKIED